MKILQIANYTEGVGGISVQVKLQRDKLRGEGLICDTISTKGSMVTRCKAIYELFTRGRGYDVFHIHACSGRGFLPAVLGISIGRLLKKHIILTYHGGGAERFFQSRHGIVKFFLSRTSENIVLSAFIGKVFDRFGIKYSVIPNIVELNETVFRIRPEIMPKFICLRSFYETYNIKCALRAFQIVQSEYSDASLTLLGDGPLRSECEQFVNENHLKNVIFAGQIPNGAIFDYLDKADIMVSSSRFDNMPVSILEGFNAGLLVIASNVGGVPYMVNHRIDGLLFEDDNPKDMAEQMLYALSHQNHVGMMIQNARKHLKDYSWEQLRDRYLGLYRMN